MSQVQQPVPGICRITFFLLVGREQRAAVIDGMGITGVMQVFKRMYLAGDEQCRLPDKCQREQRQPQGARSEATMAKAAEHGAKSNGLPWGKPRRRVLPSPQCNT